MLKRFLYNFCSSFVILMFIFIFQTIWLFIDDLAGKGLDIIIIGKFLFYLMPNLTEKVLPLTVLLSSIITFGTFAENYEFAAMKASGISLQRSMLSLIIFVTFLGGLTFYFANSVIPASEQKIYNLRRNIAKVKPAAAIEEGVFSDLEGRNIKVDRKYGENDRFLEKIIIHSKSKAQKNITVIKAKTGELISSERSDIIQLVLKDGHYYEDIEAKTNQDQKKFPFAKAVFDTYTINIELPDNQQDLEEERNVRTDKMKNIYRLAKDIDSLKENNIKVVTAFSKNISSRMGAFLPLRPRDTISDTTKINEDLIEIEFPEKVVAKDSAEQKEPFTGEIIPLFKEWQEGQIYGSAKNSVSNILSSIKGKKEELQRRYKIYNMHILSLHKKYALAFSCIILFFVGAPLGAIIRKGGLGLPMVIAIVLFLAYYFIGVFAGNYAKEGNIHPILGAWLSTLIMLPLSIYLTKRATADRGLMDFGHLTDPIRKFFKGIKQRLRNDGE
ncbi:LptF/LptG family permease [Poritiphilus sp. M415]|uniref:LptF/LptG family permease n=2 Tax=Lentiprolixibacter aurantiacus TaxID=2993939 RepID=A0AAE3SNK9_9FLAO|nr:LptF/LptG family permease [Lentiprolixibacter aurantiacus]